jgi:hypothetical protein
MSPDVRPEEEEELDEVSSEGATHDIGGLLALAKAYRTGTAPGGRDMQKCFDTYKAAAELGSAEAEYALALFALNGGLGTQDLKEGATRLRAAAEKGSVPAKVYLGNLYELGIHYKADPEKADVWYRNAARSAGIEEEVGSDEHAKALASLGCVRYVLSLVETGKVDDEAKTRLLQRAKVHGYNLKKGGGDADRPTVTDALASVEARAPERIRADTAPETKLARLKAEQAKTDASTKTKVVVDPPRAAAGLAAFGYALLFAALGVGAAYAAMIGAYELVHSGQTLPLLGNQRVHLVFPIVLGIVGVLPAWLVYKFGTVAKAMVLGAALGGVGWVAWGTGQGALHGNRGVQAIAFGLAGFLAALLVLGLLGGTKRRFVRRPVTK